MSMQASKYQFSPIWSSHFHGLDITYKLTMFSITVPATCIYTLHCFMHIAIQPNIPTNFISSDSIKSVKYMFANINNCLVHSICQSIWVILYNLWHITYSHKHSKNQINSNNIRTGDKQPTIWLYVDSGQ